MLIASPRMGVGRPAEYRPTLEEERDNEPDPIMARRWARTSEALRDPWSEPWEAKDYFALFFFVAAEIFWLCVTLGGGR